MEVFSRGHVWIKVTSKSITSKMGHIGNELVQKIGQFENCSGRKLVTWENGSLRKLDISKKGHFENESVRKSITSLIGHLQKLVAKNRSLRRNADFENNDLTFRTDFWSPKKVFDM